MKIPIVTYCSIVTAGQDSGIVSLDLGARAKVSAIKRQGRVMGQAQDKNSSNGDRDFHKKHDRMDVGFHYPTTEVRKCASLTR